MARYRKSSSVLLVDQHSTSKKPKEVVLLVVGLSLLIIGLLLALSILPFARLTEFSKHFVVASSSSSSSPSITTTKLVSRSPAEVAAAAAVQQANVKLHPKRRYGGGVRHHFEASAHEVPSGQNPDSNR